MSFQRQRVETGFIVVRFRHFRNLELQVTHFGGALLEQLSFNTKKSLQSLDFTLRIPDNYRLMKFKFFTQVRSLLNRDTFLLFLEYFILLHCCKGGGVRESLDL